jgi:predicted enzyme related to lactoylglutathione lyase
VPDELVNVRNMVDDVESAVAFYTTHFGFTVRSNAAPRSPTSCAATCACGLPV